jgi:hypothetical protein
LTKKVNIGVAVSLSEYDVPGAVDLVFECRLYTFP